MFAHDLLGKPVSTPHQVRGGLFPDHASAHEHGSREKDVGFVGLRLKQKRRSADPVKLTAGRVSPGKT
jgi:hypothetical protein